jgi:hypothetical protein
VVFLTVGIGANDRLNVGIAHERRSLPRGSSRTAVSSPERLDADDIFDQRTALALVSAMPITQKPVRESSARWRFRLVFVAAGVLPQLLMAKQDKTASGSRAGRGD